MLSKAVCALSLSVAIPAFLGYPARLDVDQREKKLHEPLTVEIWPSPAAPATTVFSVRQRWLSMQVAGANAQSQDGDVLTKELQRQLRRVGCYSGEINGVWTQSARRAMQTFTNRVNATLPVERPDPILLAMLRGHPDKDCGKPCPLDENQTPEGRCIPGAMTGLSIKATLAQPKPKPLITGWTAIETAALEEDAPKIPARAPIIETASSTFW